VGVKVGYGVSRAGRARRGKAVVVRFGLECTDVVRQTRGGGAGQGAASLGLLRSGKAVKVRSGTSGPVELRHGRADMVWYVESTHGMAVCGSRGVVWTGEVVRGEARWDLAVTVRRGDVRSG